MKRFHYFLTANLLLWACSLFMTSCEKEDVPPPIDLNTILKTYNSSKLRILLNGEEYSNEYEYAALLSMDDENTIQQGKMFLELNPLWPNVRNYVNEEYDFVPIQIPINTVSDPEKVAFVGEQNIYPYFILKAEGIWRQDSLTVSLGYKTCNEHFSNNTYFFDFSDESINLSLLHFQKSAIELNGQQIPIEEFVTDAMKIMLKVLRQNFNEGLRMTFHTDGSMDMEIKKGSDYIPIPGQYHHRLHTEEYGFLQSDYEGVTVFNNLLGLNEASFVELSALCWKIVNNHFLPFRYHLSENGEELYLGIGTQQQFHTYNFFRTWTGINMFPQSETIHNLSVEETNKVRMLANLLYEKIQGPILLKGIRE